MTGVNALMYYSTPIMNSVLDDVKKAKFGTFYINCTNFVFTILTFSIIDRVGRKILLLIGGLGCGTTQLIFGIIYNLNNRTQPLKDAAVAMFIVFIGFFATSFGPVSWVYAAEIMHPRTMMIALTVNLCFTIIIATIVPYVQIRYGLLDQ